MPKLTGSAGQLLARRRLVALPPVAPTQVVMERRRRPNGFGPNQPVAHSCGYIGATCSLPLETEHATGLIAEYRRAGAACDERACTCTCHCHAGAGECYRSEGISDGDPDSFGHRRTPNTAHRRTHRECPKEGREHQRR